MRNDIRQDESHTLTLALYIYITAKKMFVI